MSVKITPMPPRIAAISSNKAGHGRFVIVAQANRSMDTASLAEAVANSTDSKLRLIAGTAVALGSNIYRFVVEGNKQVRPFADTASMSKIGDNYADTAGALWSTVDVGGGLQQLVRAEDDDLEAILHSIRAKSPMSTIDTANVAFDAEHGSFVRGVAANGTVVQGVVVSNKIFDIASRDTHSVIGLTVFDKRATGVKLPDVDGVDMDTASAEQLADVFEYLDKILPSYFLRSLKKAVN